MATIIVQSQSSLNPRAPEFYPIYDYHNRFIITYQNLTTFSTFPSSQQYPSSCHYETSVPSLYVCYPTSHNFNTAPDIFPKLHCFSSPEAVGLSPFLVPSEQASIGHDHQVNLVDLGIDAVSVRVKGGVSKRRWSGNSCRRGLNGREDSCRRREHQNVKKDRKVKINDGKVSEESRRCRRNVRSSSGGYKQYHPVVPVRPDADNTTVMIRNIPNKYTRELLMDFLDNYCMVENQSQKAEVQRSELVNETTVSAFDFLYLPMDFAKGANKGYAFVNFTDPRAAWNFHRATDNQPWDLFQSSKIREIACARIQGKEQLVSHFHNSTFECDSDMYLPVCFSPPRDGSRVTVKQTTVGRRRLANQN
ncbi:hypothetical protein K2173_002450 [Erythroxylum novogranatense]|uniref:RRM domain-containing protein n=1 Tax=Erythroxylum novogranatense TaxID=1862640 RepID=A0AAV8T9T0_9ROSI|nr:hypothetical protein K2173_002450 [Erythroxylum novogranatense]